MLPVRTVEQYMRGTVGIIVALALLVPVLPAAAQTREPTPKELWDAYPLEPGATPAVPTPGSDIPDQGGVAGVSASSTPAPPPPPEDGTAWVVPVALTVVLVLAVALLIALLRRRRPPPAPVKAPAAAPAERLTIEWQRPPAPPPPAPPTPQRGHR